MVLKIEKAGKTPIRFYIAGAILVAVLWGVWNFAIYRPQPTVLSSSPLGAPPPETGQSGSGAAPQTSSNGMSGSGAAAQTSDAGQSESSSNSPTEWQRMAVTVESNTGSLLTTLATALLGAVGWLINEGRKTPKPKKRNLRWGFLAALCAVLSICSGAFSQGFLVTMLDADTLPHGSTYVFLNLAQFIFLLVATYLLAGFAFFDLHEEN